MVHAIRFHKTGGPEVLVWEEVNVGKPGPGEARIRHTAVGLNFVDIYNRSGLYPVQLPSGLGGEAAGVVEEVGPGVTDLKPGDVRLNGKQIQFHLPAPQVFRTRIDSAKTRVYSRQTGLLVPTDPNLETQVRQEAERQLQEAAMADGILRTAQQNAASTIRSLLQGLGFEKIDFD